jgi:hypothetical protein
MSIKQRTGLHPWGRNEPKAKGPDFVFGIILTHLFHDQRGRKHFEGSNDSVFGDSCQKGGEMSPKQKDRTTTNQFQKLSVEYFQLISYCVQREKKVVFQKWYIKTLLNTKRRISLRWSFV